MVQVLFDAATSEPLFRVDLTSLVLIPRTSSESIIRHVAVISKLLLCWKIWEQGSQEMMEMILGGLVILTRRDHPHRTFNVKQLLADSVLRVLFNIYLVSHEPLICLVISEGQVCYNNLVNFV